MNKTGKRSHNFRLKIYTFELDSYRIQKKGQEKIFTKSKNNEHRYYKIMAIQVKLHSDNISTTFHVEFKKKLHGLYSGLISRLDESHLKFQKSEYPI